MYYGCAGPAPAHSVAVSGPPPPRIPDTSCSPTFPPRLPTVSSAIYITLYMPPRTIHRLPPAANAARTVTAAWTFTACCCVSVTFTAAVLPHLPSSLALPLTMPHGFCSLYHAVRFSFCRHCCAVFHLLVSPFLSRCRLLPPLTFTCFLLSLLLFFLDAKPGSYTIYHGFTAYTMEYIDGFVVLLPGFWVLCSYIYVKDFSHYAGTVWMRRFSIVWVRFLP